jgi:hypothetical protein
MGIRYKFFEGPNPLDWIGEIVLHIC